MLLRLAHSMCSSVKGSANVIQSSSVQSNWHTVVQVFVCRSGSAADTQAISAYVEHYIEQHEMELGRDVAVKTTANLAMQLVYNNKVGSPKRHTYSAKRRNLDAGATWPSRPLPTWRCSWLQHRMGLLDPNVLS